MRVVRYESFRTISSIPHATLKSFIEKCETKYQISSSRRPYRIKKEQRNAENDISAEAEAEKQQKKVESIKYDS